MKYKLNDYYIGDIAKFYGFTVETVRFYDKKGILSPPKNRNNNYRTYSKEDFITMDYIMRMRKLGISLEEIKHIVTKSNLQEVLEIMDGKDHNLEQRIAELQEQKSLLLDYRRKLEDCARNFGKVEIIQSPAFIVKDIDGSMEDTMEFFRALEPTLLPLLTVRGLHQDYSSSNLNDILLDREKRQAISDYVVTLADEKGIWKREDFPKDCFQVIPPTKCLHAIGMDYTNVNYAGFDFIIEYIKENQIEIREKPLFRIIATENNEGRGAEYIEVWLPIE